LAVVERFANITHNRNACIRASQNGVPPAPIHVEINNICHLPKTGKERVAFVSIPPEREVLTDAKGANNSESEPLGSQSDHDFVLKFLRLRPPDCIRSSLTARQNKSMLFLRAGGTMLFLAPRHR
jgi:hypothetical protein